MNAIKLNCVIDISIGIAFGLTLTSGLMAHSVQGRMEFHTFAGMFMSIGIVVHLMLHRKWMAAASRSSEKSSQLKLNLWLNRLLGLSWLWALLSGWHSHLDFSTGSPTHALAAVIMLCILLVHLARHWKWITTTARRYGIKP